jgi:hypothetical protein
MSTSHSLPMKPQVRMPNHSLERTRPARRDHLKVSWRAAQLEAVSPLLNALPMWDWTKRLVMSPLSFRRYFYAEHY